MINKQSYQITGMRQDNLVGTGASTKFAHEIMNMRINTTGDYTTASWTTEKGTLLKNITWSEAPSDALGLLYNNHNTIIPIGQAVINDQWIIFATQSETPEIRIGYDFIFKYNYQENSDVIAGTILYAGNLNFDAQHPCETLSFYENDNIQKVYWTDGKNQPRVINITNTTYHTGLDGQFDFVQDVSLNEHVTIKKNTDGAGLFPPCTVKYAITYYKKNGQETNIVYDSPLYYPIKGQRACSPDELSGDSFEIRVTGIDDTHGFDYIRLYSIVRTTEDATPIVRIVADKELATLPVITNDQDPDYNPNTSNKYALFIDTNTTGEIVDPTIIQYVGGKEIVVQTFDQKNNTLFLGNIEIKTKSVQSALDDYNAKHPNNIVTVENFNGESGAFSISEEDMKKVGISSAKFGDNSFYKYSNQMTEGDFTDVQQNTLYPALPDKIYNTTESLNGSSDKIKIFKYGETYRFGIQFQDSKGNWSEVIHLTDTTNINHPITNTDSSVAKFATFKYNLPENVRTALVEEGFKKARIVCCYPNNADRTILTQGVICPTMTNEDFENTPDAMSSWFFRPLLEHDYIANKREEVQNRTTKFNYSNDIFTINSAEIELDESIRTLDLDHTNINIVGTVPVSSYASTYHVEAGSPMTVRSGHKGHGFEKLIDVQSGNLNDIRNIGKSASYWNDLAVYNWDQGRYKPFAYPLYPFERKGSLNDYVGDAEIQTSCWDDKTNTSTVKDTNITKTAELQSKVYANLSYAKTALYLDTLDNNFEDISIQFFDSNEVIPIKLSNDNIYYGNMNTIFPSIKYDITLDGVDLQQFHFLDRRDGTNGIKHHYFYGSYHVYDENAYGDNYYRAMKDLDWSVHTNNQDIPWEMKWYNHAYCVPVTSDPIPMTYNSIPHVVLKDSRLSEPLKSISYNVPSLPLVEITKNNANKFRGDAKDSIFIPCGPATKIDNQQNVILYGIEGDHYFMRYDCLKTYPRALDDTNQIVEILSYMCETRINLDGRYDKNRGLTDNTIITNTNFNLINKSYTQSNNLFNYTTLDEDASKLNKYANLITWTKDKVSGEDVDLWTNITMASTADVEGTCGAINKIININDTLYNFQDHGIAQIGYNEKTALSTEAGIPLEIANSGKYSGLKYISKEVGCQNKWSISSTKNGCFFIDDSRQELLALNEELTSLSTINGFDAFLIQQLPDTEHFTPWTPINPNNFVSYYDKLGNDVFFINKDYCLAWNEQSKTFTSFYSYNNVPIMANIGTHLLMWDLNSILSLDIQEQTSSKTVTTYEKQVTTTTSTETHVIGDNIDKLPIFDDDTYLEAIFYHYKEGSSLNEGLTNTDPIDYNGAKVWQINNLADRDTPTIIWIQNQISNIKQGWIRFTTQNKNYSTLNYQWNANYILSLEFRKLDANNNEVPYIIQFEVNGIHKRLQSRNGWNTVDATPSIKIRATENFTDEEFELIKNGLFLGGQNQPTFNAGNVVYSYGYYSSNGTQPWNNIADSFTYTINDTERELLCIVKLYDLNKSTSEFKTLDINTADYIQYIQAQGNPFRTQDQSDSSCDFDNTLYNPNDLRYDAETVTEVITNTQVAWIPSTATVTTKQYTVKDVTSTSNIWSARELPEYCKFFGNVKNYWMTIVCDGITDKGSAFPADKVFNNIEYRADIFNMEDNISNNPHTNYNNSIFNIKHVWNGYQNSQEVTLDSERKFNTWRVQLPRHYGTRDRIRNPFCYIKLKQDQTINTQTDRAILHDLAVYFDMR